ncbi:hypothetical protein SHELI_v1c03430 [Spiroplasma helicoides]|uniref:Uncharacterized protein n=1 Tax=Spiroplasma helicoides TaxID=216938 RepID=A0A1B3SK49_9MOLU|nr:lipoprotein [Spiroplasma helicoides]AOG60298.1 hypothetical protein SHELI_v1c03430 [Spiroplasma helicoides]
MKKLLGLLGAIGLTATSASTVIACPSKNSSSDEDQTFDLSAISANDLVLNPDSNSQEDVEQAAIDTLYDKYNADVVKDTDFSVEFNQATHFKKGSLVIKAKSSTNKLLGKATFEYQYVITQSLIKNESRSGWTGTNNSFAVSLTQEGDGKSQLEATVADDSSKIIEDLTVDNTNSNHNKFIVRYTALKAGLAKIVIKYKNFSKTININVIKTDLSAITGTNFYIKPLFNSENGSVEVITAKIKERLGIYAKVGEDFSVDKSSLNLPVEEGKNGSIKIIASSSSEKIVGNVSFSLVFREKAEMEKIEDTYTAFIDNSMYFELTVKNANGVTIPSVEITNGSDKINLPEIKMDPNNKDKFIVTCVGKAEGSANIRFTYGENSKSEDQVNVNLTVKPESRFDLSSLKEDQLNIKAKNSSEDENVKQLIVNIISSLSSEAKETTDFKIDSDKVRPNYDEHNLEDGSYKNGWAKVSANPRSELLKGNADFTVFKSTTKLSDLFKGDTYELGPIPMKTTIPTKEELIIGLNSKSSSQSPVFAQKSFNLISANESKAVIEGLGRFEGTETINYSKAPDKINLSKVVTNKNLGVVNGAYTTPNPMLKDVVNRLNELYPKYDFLKNYTEFSWEGSNKKTGCVLVAKSTSIHYTGNVTLTYTYKPKSKG